VTPSHRTALIAKAKSLAIPVASCVAASIRPSRLLEGRSRDELMALVIVLAEAVDPVRLREVVSAEDGGAPLPAVFGGHRNAGQMAAYAWLRRERKSIEGAAAELGIVKRTAERYEHVLVAAGEATWERRGPGRVAA
jgi:hypothetical protein